MPDYDEITIVVPGEIVPWKRAQKRRNKDGSFTVFTDPRVDGYLSVVRHEAKLVMGTDPPLECALELSAIGVWLPPKGWSNIKRKRALAGMIPKITRPDVSNMIKGAEDAIRKIVYRDDAQVVSYGRCAKIYGDRPRLEIRLTVVERVAQSLPVTPTFLQPDLFAGMAA
jgi:Holliday junction resolvase RusA-like endonuclease